VNRQVWRVAFTSLLLLLTASVVHGQFSPSQGGSSQDALANGSIMVSVWGPNHLTLSQQAVVNLYSVMSGTPVKTSVTSGASQVVFTNIPGFGRYIVEVVSAGYKTARQDVDYNSTYTRSQVDITLQPVAADGNAEAPAGLVPAISSKAQKHVQKGLSELQAGNLTEAQKELTAAFNAAPKNSYICYLLGVVYLKTKDLEHAVVYLGMATSLDPKNTPALVALGQLRHQQGDYAGATEPLERAVSLDSKQWLADWLLADIHFRSDDFEKARQEAEKAVEVGKGAANQAEFVEAEALSKLGRREEAVKLFETFLHDMPEDPAAPAARAYLAKLRPSPKAEVSVATAPAGTASPTAPAVATVTPPTVEAVLPSWEPADVVRVKPLIAEGVSCPAEQVINGASERVTQLVENVNNITATEKVVFEGLDAMGRTVTTGRRDYYYLAFITDNDQDLPIISEDRDETSGIGDSPQHMSLFALQELALIFHPQLRSDFQMTCEGLGKWQGQATWVVYFRQRPDRPKRLRSYRIDQNSYAAGLKGRAWI
jgi:tetratricopeptide (TPR) repeat protein